MTSPVAKSLFARRSSAFAAVIPFATLLSPNAHADLTDLINAGQLTGYNEIQLQSAIATQAVYDQLQNGTAQCQDNDGMDGNFDPQPDSCSGGTYLVWRNVREVVHNANQLTNNNELPTHLEGELPTRFTLGRNVTQLGGALQWCNGEEFASLNSLATNFISAQASSLAARVTALRFGASGFQASTFNVNDDETLASTTSRRGGGASADGDDDGDYDATNSPWSVWGIFGNGSYLKGEKIPTGSEEGFKYKGPTFNIGIDKRLSRGWVLGAMLGYQKQSMDFESFPPSFASVGGSDMSGLSVQPYALYESDHWYLNLSLGYQNISFDTNRNVNYGTQPGTTLDVYFPISHVTTDDSKSKANSLSSYDTLGFSIRPVAAWSIEPSLSIDYQHIRIGQFTENDLDNQGFAFTVDGQTINSFEGIPELRMQYTFTPRFGVWTPYVDVQWHHQFNTDPRTISALYADAQGNLTTAASFTIKTDELDPWYQVYSVGIATVIRGSSAGETHSSGGLQLYANYRRYEGLRSYQQQIYAAGLRYEF